MSAPAPHVVVQIEAVALVGRPACNAHPVDWVISSPILDA
jgi:hypothetical protein